MKEMLGIRSFAGGKMLKGFNEMELLTFYAVFDFVNEQM